MVNQKSLHVQQGIVEKETPRKHKMPESIQARKNWIKSTQELIIKMKNHLLCKEQQGFYHECLQDGCTFLKGYL